MGLPLMLRFLRSSSAGTMMPIRAKIPTGNSGTPVAGVTVSGSHALAAALLLLSPL